MKEYINTKTNEYPVYEVHIKARGMGFSNYQEVFDITKPSYNSKLQMCIEVSPIFTEGKYYKQYQIIDKQQSQLDQERQQAIEKKVKDLAAYRYQKETGGISINGFQMYTDRDTQGKIQSAAIRAEKDPEFTVQWKTMDGNFITLDASTIIEIGNAVFDHVQACYAREAELQLEIEKDPDTDITTGWSS